MSVSTPLPVRSALAALATALFAFSAPARAQAPDAQFVQEAASGSRLEIELGRYAADHAQDDAVKRFGERMVDDHGRASRELQDAAQQAGLSVPAEMQPKHRQTLDRLTGLQGAEFDRAYLREMVSDHAREVERFRQQAEAGSSPIDQWAERTVPVLEEHLEQARTLRSGLAEPTGAAGTQEEPSD